MGRRPRANREADQQALKQAAACAVRAYELFVKEDDKQALAQVALAERFFDEFIERNGD